MIGAFILGSLFSLLLMAYIEFRNEIYASIRNLFKGDRHD